MVTCLQTQDIGVELFARIEALQSQGIIFTDRFLQGSPFERPIEDRAIVISESMTLPSERSGFMAGRLEDLKRTNLDAWISRAATCERLDFQGYTIFTHIDGAISHEREVSLVTAERGAFLPPHIHEKSDALLVVTGGSARFITYSEERAILNRGQFNLLGRGPQIIAERLDDQGLLTGFRFVLGPVICDVTAQEVREGDMVMVPRGLPHGFLVPSEIEQLKFAAFQSPPIHDERTGEFDFVPMEGVLQNIIPRTFRF